MKRRLLLTSMLLLTVFSNTHSIAASNATGLSGKSITVYRSATCGCCKGYIEVLKAEGMDVSVVIQDNPALEELKTKLGVPQHLRSCHTAVMSGYVIEGHVPTQALLNLSINRPKLSGIALPGMPAGSPGMGGVKSAPFDIRDLKGNEFLKI